jgi:hypothetical protein
MHVWLLPLVSFLFPLVLKIPIFCYHFHHYCMSNFILNDMPVDWEKFLDLCMLSFYYLCVTMKLRNFHMWKSLAFILTQNSLTYLHEYFIISYFKQNICYVGDKKLWIIELLELNKEHYRLLINLGKMCYYHKAFVVFFPSLFLRFLFLWWILIFLRKQWNVEWKLKICRHVAKNIWNHERILQRHQIYNAANAMNPSEGCMSYAITVKWKHFTFLMTGS